MKNSPFLLLLLAAACVSCGIKKYGKAQEDFWLFQSREDHTIQRAQSPIKKFGEGIYQLEICKTDTIIEGVHMKWLKQGPCHNEDSVYQYGYLIFLDNYRVYYFTDFKNDTAYRRTDDPLRWTKYCISKEQKLEAYFQKERFDIAYDVYPFSMRGYYKVRNGLPYKTQNTKTCNWQIELELEKINEKKEIWLILCLNEKTQTLSIQEAYMKYDYDRLPYNTDFSDGNDSNGARNRTVFFDDIFSLIPSFRWSGKSVHFYHCDCESSCATTENKKDCLKKCRKECPDEARQYFDNIDYNFQDSIINYNCKGQTIWQESFKKSEKKEHFQTW